jgi:hypothetical protein
MDTERSASDDAVVPPVRSRRQVRRVLLVALALTAAAGGTARAQTTPPATTPAPAAQAAPGERAAAREFSFAAYRLRVAVLAQKQAIEDKLLGLTLGALSDPRCDRVEKAAPGLVGIEVLLVELVLDITPAYDPVRTSLDAFLAQIEAVPTNDRALRSGRAGWRSEIQFIRQLQSSPDPCGSLQAWQRKHFAPSQSPVNLDAVGDEGLNAAEGKIKLAARRMRALGVSDGAAARFTGDGMFRGVGLSLF